MIFERNHYPVNYSSSSSDSSSRSSSLDSDENEAEAVPSAESGENADPSFFLLWSSILFQMNH